MTSVLHAAPEISQAFFEYYVTEDGELGLGMSGRLLTEEQLFEKILDPLVFPGGRPATQAVVLLTASIQRERDQLVR